MALRSRRSRTTGPEVVVDVRPRSRHDSPRGPRFARPPSPAARQGGRNPRSCAPPAARVVARNRVETRFAELDSAHPSPELTQPFFRELRDNPSVFIAPSNRCRHPRRHPPWIRKASQELSFRGLGARDAIGLGFPGGVLSFRATRRRRTASQSDIPNLVPSRESASRRASFCRRE